MKTYSEADYSQIINSLKKYVISIGGEVATHDKLTLDLSDNKCLIVIKDNSEPFIGFRVTVFLLDAISGIEKHGKSIHRFVAEDDENIIENFGQFLNKL